MKTKVEISFLETKFNDWDFGNFLPHKKQTLKVDRDFWTEYLKARQNFETMHGDLIRRAKRKLGNYHK